MRRQPRDRRAKVRIGIVPEFRHATMTIERRLDDPTLHTSTATVHQTHLTEASAGGRFDVFIDDRRNISRSKRVQIEFAFDRNLDRIAHQDRTPPNCAVTTGLMPPRTETSPTTVIRRSSIAATRSSS